DYPPADVGAGRHRHGDFEIAVRHLPGGYGPSPLLSGPPVRREREGVRTGRKTLHQKLLPARHGLPKSFGQVESGRESPFFTRSASAGLNRKVRAVIQTLTRGNRSH